MCHTHSERNRNCRTASKSHGISFGFWNVHGLGRKVEDSDFVSQIEGFDFFSLLETWHEGEKHFPNFLCFSSTRTKTKKAKRSSGGIIFLFKKQYKNFVTKLDSKSEDILWVKVNKELLNMKEDIYLASVYISPNRSTIHSNRTYDIFDELENEIAYYQNYGEVIVGGD